MCLPVKYTASINKNRWHGVAKIPKSYFPPNVNLFNAYAIHGTGEDRVYEALYPAPTDHFEYPDLYVYIKFFNLHFFVLNDILIIVCLFSHRLEFFRYVDFSEMLPAGHPLSKVWQDAVQSSSNFLFCIIYITLEI